MDANQTPNETEATPQTEHASRPVDADVRRIGQCGIGQCGFSDCFAVTELVKHGYCRMCRAKLDDISRQRMRGAF